MCQACLALASRRSGSSNWPVADGEAKTPGRFSGVAEWADTTAEDEQPAQAAPEGSEPPVDAPRS